MKTYKVKNQPEMFAVVIPNVTRARRIAEAFEYIIGHNTAYTRPEGIVFEIKKSNRREALEIIDCL